MFGQFLPKSPADPLALFAAPAETVSNGDDPNNNGTLPFLRASAPPNGRSAEEGGADGGPSAKRARADSTPAGTAALQQQKAAAWPNGNIGSGRTSREGSTGG